MRVLLMRCLTGNNPFKGKIIDITTPISPFTPVFPGDPKPAIERLFSLENEGFAVSRLILGSHTGTHVDASSHVLEMGLPIDKLELENMMGTAIVLDFSSLKGVLTVDVLEKALKSADISYNVSIILLKTASSSKIQKSEGLDPLYLDESSALWIVENKFKAVGIDSFSVDNLDSETLPAHRILLSGNVSIVECLELSSVDPGIYFFICLPLKIEGCDGAPARALLFSESEFNDA
jgi:arylformamidase